MPFKIVRNDILKMDTEAIVNIANREGKVFITPGFNLPAKYIIHAVSPLYADGMSGEEEKLRSCYSKSLELAKEHNIRSIAFPLIATGSFGYPKEEGMRIAVDEINAFLLKNDMDIRLVVFDSMDTKLGEKIYPGLEAYIDHNYVIEKRLEEYGDEYYGSCMQGDGYNAYDRMDNEPGVRYTRSVRVESPEISPAYEDTPLLAAAPLSAPQIKPREKVKNKPGFSIFKKAKEKAGADASIESLKEADICAAYDVTEDEDFDEISAPHTMRLNERMEHMSDTFSEYLLYLIQDKGLTNAEVYTRAIVDKKAFSKIKNNKNAHPQKITALCLCMGAMLNLDESIDLLARAGYALSPCDKTDIIFSYFIENEIYDMIELDLQLDAHGLPGLIR